MNIREVILIAYNNVRNNMLRSVLTLLIIAFGLMALVGILTAIDSIIYAMNDNFSRLGANSFSIESMGSGRGHRDGKSTKRGPTISFDQAMKFKDKYKYPATVSISLRGTQTATISNGDKKTNPNIMVIGSDENFLDVHGHDLEMGRNFMKNEILNASPKAIIGIALAKKLFTQPKKALQKTISIASSKYKVVGILKSEGSSMGANVDNNVFLTLVNTKNRYGSASRNYEIDVKSNNADDLPAAIGNATGVFRNIRSLRIGSENDFEIKKSDGIAKMLQENTVQIQIGAIAIGLMTLFGAAIGLMNIMLVSVTERTKEIGIIKALGATRKNILIQFMTEAIIICQVGGVLGIVLGILIGVALSFGLGGSFHMPWGWTFLGLALSFIVGVISGLYPAIKASKLDPIEALRHE